MNLEGLKNWYAKRSWNRLEWQTRQNKRMTRRVRTGVWDALADRDLTNLVFLDRDDRSCLVARGMDVAWSGRNAGDGFQINQSFVPETIFEIPRDVVGFHVTQFEDKLKDDYTEQSARLVDLAILSTVQEIDDRLSALSETLPDAPVTVVVFGGLLSKSFLEPDNWYWHFLGRMDVGFVAGPLSFWKADT